MAAGFQQILVERMNEWTYLTEKINILFKDEAYLYHLPPMHRVFFFILLCLFFLVLFFSFITPLFLLFIYHTAHQALIDPFILKSDNYIKSTNQRPLRQKLIYKKVFLGAHIYPHSIQHCRKQTTHFLTIYKDFIFESKFLSLELVLFCQHWSYLYVVGAKCQLLWNITLTM